MHSMYQSLDSIIDVLKKQKNRRALESFQSEFQDTVDVVHSEIERLNDMWAPKERQQKILDFARAKLELTKRAIAELWI